MLTDFDHWFRTEWVDHAFYPFLNWPWRTYRYWLATRDWRSPIFEADQ